MTKKTDKAAAPVGDTNPPEIDAAADGSGLPMFYRRPEAMNPARHAKHALMTRPDFGFARVAHAIPVMAAEMPAAMRSYPIVFVGPQKMPVVITGLRRDENLFVDSQGRWAVPHYVPAYVRRYPFVLAGDEKAERLTLCIDAESDRVVEPGKDGKLPGEASPLFVDGQPSDATKQALAFCEQYQGMLNATRAIVAKVMEHGLFADRQSKITLEGGETINLTDFQVIDEAALNALSDDAFLDLRKSGALSLVYCHLASMNSWNSLLHQARNHVETA